MEEKEKSKRLKNLLIVITAIAIIAVLVWLVFIVPIRRYYENNRLDIPIYSITFGSSSEYELSDIADIESAPELVGRNMTMILAPKK